MIGLVLAAAFATFSIIPGDKPGWVTVCGENGCIDEGPPRAACWILLARANDEKGIADDMVRDRLPGSSHYADMAQRDYSAAKACLAAHPSKVDV